MRGVIEHIFSAFRRRGTGEPAASPQVHGREPVDHVILLDGTMGTLNPERITSVGILYRFLRRSNPRLSL